MGGDVGGVGEFEAAGEGVLGENWVVAMRGVSVRS